MKSGKVYYNYLSVQSLKVAYREAGKMGDSVLFLALEEFCEDITEEIISYWHLHFNT